MIETQRLRIIPLNMDQLKMYLRPILAQTDIGNLPSHAILIKNDFKSFKTVEEKIWWRLPTA